MTMLPSWLTSPTGSADRRGPALRVAPDDAGTDRPARPLVVLPFRSVGPLQVEAHGVADVVRFRDDWADLVGRCLDPNVFMEPDFCLPAAQHIAPARRPAFVLVWDPGDDGRRRLMAVCPLLRPGLPFGRPAHSWFHDLAALSGPLLDRDRADAALQAILAWIAARHPGCGAWQIPSLPADGETARAVSALAGRTARHIRGLDPRRRAILRRPEAEEPAGLAAVSRKKAKDIARQRRLLAAQGTLGYESATSGDDLRDALERFLLLESQGWKGRRGTAMLLVPEQAAFARTMTRLMGRDAKCRIDALTLDGKPIAMGILLSSGGVDSFWKMAYDETHASASPGVQFVLDLTLRQAQAPGVALTDSCAIPDHPMIDHLWRGRLDLVDLMIAVCPGRSFGFRAALGLERVRRRARAGLKQWVLGLRAARARRRSGVTRGAAPGS